MSVAEMKKKAVDLINKLENEKKLEQILEVLSDTVPRQFSAEEVYKITAEKYHTTLQKLAE